MFKGSMPALVTPMLNGEVDVKALKRLINWQIEEGSHGLVPVGTTGESPTLTHDEHEEVIRITLFRTRLPKTFGCEKPSTTA